MIFNVDLLRKIMVQVNGKGSGLIVPSAEQERFYCLTAKHCINEGVIELTQSTGSSENISLEYADFLEDMDETHDLAIILLKNYSAQNYPQNAVFVGNVNKAYIEGGLTGFPQSRDDLEVYKVALVGVDDTNKTLKMHLLNTNTTQIDLKEQIDGISGGGVFAVENNNEYKLLGIETEIADKNAGFNEIIGITLAMANNLLKSKGWPLLATPKYHYASMGWEEGKNVLIKEGEYRNKWVNTKDSGNLTTIIQEHFFKEEKPLLLCGFSGIGKTRTVLQACVQNPELSNALFFDSYEQFIRVFNSRLREYLDISEDEPVYLIVDDVHLYEWEQLNQILQNHKNVRALFIAEMGQTDIDISYSTQHRIIQMKPYDEDDVIEIVRDHYKFLSDEDLQSIFRLSDNDLRFAFLIADVYSQSDDKELWSLPIQRSGKQILDRIMTQVVGEKHFEIIKIFSLFVDFGYNGNSKKEIDFIKEYFGQNEIILNQAIDFFADHHLGIKRGNFFELSPRALARLLFSEYHMYAIKDYSNFMDRLPTDELRRRFVMRAYECGGETWKGVRDTLVSWFRKKYGCAALVVSVGFRGNEYVELSVGNIAEAMTYVEFIPDDGLQWMYSLIQNADGYVLDKFSGYSARRQFVCMCEQLSCFIEHFEICEKILFELSQHETEGRISNNSSGVWSTLYGIFVSNTEYPFKKRIDLLISRMRNCNNEINYSLFKSALSCALSISGTRLVPPKMIGGRLTPASWAEQHIQTLEDIVDANIYVLTNLNQIASSMSSGMCHVVSQVLIDHIEEYISFGHKLYSCYRETLELFAVDPEQQLEIVIAINTHLEYEKKRRENQGDNFASNQRINELIQWRDSIAQTDLISRIKVCLAEFFIHTDDEYMENMKRLAVELIERPDAPEMLRTILSFNDIHNYSYSRLARVLGEADEEYKLKEVMKENFVCGSNSFSEEYYFGIFCKEKNMPYFLKQLLSQTITENPEGVLRVSVVCDFSNEGTERIINLLEEGIVNNYILDLGEQWQIRQLTLAQKERILSALVANCHAHDSIFCFFLIGNKWLSTGSSAELEDIIYRNIVNLPLEECRRDSTNFVNLLELMPHHLQDCLSLAIQSIDYSSPLKTQTKQILFVKKHSYGQFAKEIAFCACDCLEKQFEQMPVFHSFSLLMNLLVPDIVLKWIECKPSNRAKIVAYHLPAPSLEEQNVPEITKKVLEQYKNDEKVFQRFIIGIHAFEVYNLENVEKNSEKNFATLEEYKKYPLDPVRKWAEFEISRIKSILEDKKQLDSADRRFDDD